MFQYGNISLDFGQEKVTNTSDFAGVPLGTRAVLPDQRVFRYSFSQGAIPAGQLTMAKAGTAALDMDLVLTTQAVDTKQITATIASGNATVVDFYKGGYVYVNDGAGEGHIYYIQGNAAVAATDTSIVLRTAEDVVREALASGTSLGGLMENPYNDVEVYDADDIDGPPLGVAPTEIADNAYFWNQTWGWAAVLAEATVPVVGKTVSPGSGTDGAVELTILTSATPDSGADQPIVGIAALIAPVATDYGMVYLTIAP